MVPDPAAEVPPFYKNWRCVLGLALVMGVNVIWEVLNDVPAIWDMAYHQLMGLSYLQAWRAGTDQRQIEFPRIDSSKIELMAYRCLIKNRTENLMRRSQIEEEVEFGVTPRIVDAYR